MAVLSPDTGGSEQPTSARPGQNLLDNDAGTKAISKSDSHNSVPNRARRSFSAVSIPGSMSQIASSTPTQDSVVAVLSSSTFNLAIGLVIFANSVTVGLEQSYRHGDYEDQRFICEILENIFLSIYIVELSMRVYAYSWRCFRDRWVQFDSLLVGLGVSTNWILFPILGQIDGVAPLMVLRTGRLLRLARTLRLLMKFRELWMLVRGLLSSASTMLYTLLILIMTLYIFSCVAMELITMHEYALVDGLDPEFAAHVEFYFPNLEVTMLSLLQFIIVDNVSLIYVPLVMKLPYLAIYFVILILVVSIVLMNLVTAVVVNSALEQAMQDKEMIQLSEMQKRKKLVRDLEAIFRRIDEDASGEITKDEIANIDSEDRKTLEQLLTKADPNEIFDMLDVDKSGSIGIEEFCQSVWDIATSKSSIELKRTEKKVDKLQSVLDSIYVKEGKEKKPVVDHDVSLVRDDAPLPVLAVELSQAIHKDMRDMRRTVYGTLGRICEKLGLDPTEALDTPMSPKAGGTRRGAAWLDHGHAPSLRGAGAAATLPASPAGIPGVAEEPVAGAAAFVLAPAPKGRADWKGGANVKEVPASVSCKSVSSTACPAKGPTTGALSKCCPSCMRALDQMAVENKIKAINAAFAQLLDDIRTTVNEGPVHDIASDVPASTKSASPGARGRPGGRHRTAMITGAVILGKEACSDEFATQGGGPPSWQGALSHSGPTAHATGQGRDVWNPKAWDLEDNSAHLVDPGALGAKA